MTVTTQTQEGVTVVKTTNSPALALITGAMDVTFEQYEKVVQAAVFLEDPIAGLNDTAFTTTWSVSDNVVTVIVMKTTISAVSPEWAIVETANLAGEDVVVVADCI